MTEPEQPWAILYHGDHVSIEPVENGCRDYDCTGGCKTCGFTAAEAQETVVHHYQRHADHWRGMTPSAFLKAQGYPALAHSGDA
jgi:hypothetical protein